MPLADPTEQTSQSDLNHGRWMLVIFNNDHTTVGEVIAVLMLATGCDQEEAEIETWEAHHFGKAAVHFGTIGECAKAAKIIGRVGVLTEIRKEWEEGH